MTKIFAYDGKILYKNDKVFCSYETLYENGIKTDYVTSNLDKSGNFSSSTLDTNGIIVEMNALYSFQVEYDFKSYGIFAGQFVNSKNENLFTFFADYKGYDKDGNLIDFSNTFSSYYDGPYDETIANRYINEFRPENQRRIDHNVNMKLTYDLNEKSFIVDLVYNKEAYLKYTFRSVEPEEKFYLKLGTNGGRIKVNNVRLNEGTNYLVPKGIFEITENGEHNVKAYEKVLVNVPIPSEYIIPSGTINITNNGEYNVRAFEKANVNLPKPTAEIDITTNGIYDVSDYGTANVNIEMVLENNTLTELPNNYLDASSKVTSFKSSSITKLKSNTFYGCLSLKNIELPNLTETNGSSFENCGVEKLYLPSYIKSTSSGPATGCPNLIEVELPKIVDSNYVKFENCPKLKIVNMPLATRFYFSIFRNCTSLQVVNAPMVSTIDYKPFENCTSLETINLPNITAIDNGMFTGCEKLKNVNVPLVNKIESYGFENCTSLETINLPSVSSIEIFSFKGCSGLKDIHLGYVGIVTAESYRTFENSTKGIKVHVRSAYADQYATATNWVDLINDGTIIIVGDYTD